MNKQNWSSATYQLNQQGKAYVMVTLIGITGSTPRDSGTKMVITHDEFFDTIGGGHLEFKATKFAHKLLKKGVNAQHIEHFQLGSQLGQCCGGTATVLFECFAATGINIMLFGAGHVGQALMPILSALPCQITWVDSRAEQFPVNAETLNNTRVIVSETPEDEVANMPANSYFIVMTHNHQMDFDISQAILKRGDFAYLGLIASDTKWRRFKQRYKHRDIDEALVERMHCPIGLPDVTGKLPMEVAVSVAGQIISCYQANEHQNIVQDKGSQQGVPLKTIKQLVSDIN
ncbi:xanthine dehydrogenase accessory protein XdhC [Pseudocolwellia agarivorans]|uniref:xanthine dehydrogenase accessory protein XdhC n=1 Tax=Pseudocolwellia agarivorans TaxID=1911682 RepID=UPI000987C5C1|nr:xanthine dehydrogenase accessory protein XdhC [Pseudocolwellia agarivorans]